MFWLGAGQMDSNYNKYCRVTSINKFALPRLFLWCLNRDEMSGGVDVLECCDGVLTGCFMMVLCSIECLHRIVAIKFPWWHRIVVAPSLKPCVDVVFKAVCCVWKSYRDAVSTGTTTECRDSKGIHTYQTYIRANSLGIPTVLTLFKGWRFRHLSYASYVGGLLVMWTLYKRQSGLKSDR